MTPGQAAAESPTPEDPLAIAFGRFAMQLDAPNLRRVTIDQYEFAQTITFTVRDQNWGTVEPSNIEATVENRKDATHIHFTARYTSDEIDLELVADVDAHNDSLTYSTTATALKDFLRCRIGICVMHPASLAGRPLYITTPDDQYTSMFPIDVSADRSTTNIVSMRHSVGETTEVLLEFSGDVFEFEDQRNWADASYKTFCTPLALPRPVQIVAGQVMQQSLRVSTTHHTSSPAPAPVGRRTNRARASIELAADGPTVPSIGVFASARSDAFAAASDLGVPHVRATIDVSRIDGSSFDGAVDALIASGLDLELELVTDSSADIERAHDGLSALKPTLKNVYVFERETQITPKSFRPGIEHLRTATGLRVGGGSGRNFGAINFNIDEIPIQSLDSLTFPMSPQMHYTDDFSVLVNIDAQQTVCENGLRIAAGRDLSIGPITLLPRNAGTELASDPRSGSLFEAAWTVGSLSQLVGAGASALTYHQTTGPGGVIDIDGKPTPTYHVLADIAAYSEARVLPVTPEADHARIAIVALQTEHKTLVVVANLESWPVDVELAMQPDAAQIRILDENTVDLAREGCAALLTSSAPWNGGGISLTPFAIATLVVEN